MTGKKYIISILIIATMIIFFNEYQDRKHYIDRNLMEQITANSLNINHSMARIAECVHYIENENSSAVDLDRVIKILEREIADIRDSRSGMTEIRGVNPNIKIHYRNFTDALNDLVENIKTNDEISASDLEQLKILSQINLETKTSNFYKSQPLFLDSKPQDWVISQYDDLDKLGLELIGDKNK